MTKKRELPKYCYPMPNRHGTERYYFWRGEGHPKVRVNEPLLSPAFFTAYAAFLGGEALKKHGGAEQIKAKPLRGPGVPAHTLRWLCDKYLASNEFRGGLNLSTQNVRKNILTAICETPHPKNKDEVWGHIPVDKLTMGHIKHIRDTKLVWTTIDDPEGEAEIQVRTNTEGANSWLKALRAVFKWACNESALNVGHNPTLGLNLYPGTAEGFHCWTLAEVEQYRAFYPIGTRPRLAFELLYNLAQRRGDLAQIGKRTLIRDGKGREVFKIVQEKRGRKDGQRTAPSIAFIPYFPELKAIVEATPEAGEDVFFVKPDGTPYTKESFGNWFSDRCTDAGLPQCSAHGLRKAFVVEMIRRRYTAQQIMAMTGHKTQKEFDRYAREFLRAQAAEQILDDWLREAA
jgi:site-specific recombinase XerD